MPGPETRVLFDSAARLGIGFYLGYAEKAGDGRFNTAIIVDNAGRIVKSGVGPWTEGCTPGIVFGHETAGSDDIKAMPVERTFHDPDDTRCRS